MTPESRQGVGLRSTRRVPCSDLYERVLARDLGVNDVLAVTNRSPCSTMAPGTGSELLLGPLENLANITHVGQVESRLAPSDAVRRHALEIRLFPDDSVGGCRRGGIARTARTTGLPNLHQ